MGIALAVLSSYSAAFCLFTYAKSEADPALRRWAGAFTMATPILTTAGIIAWALMMPDLGEIPRVPGPDSASRDTCPLSPGQSLWLAQIA